MFLTFIAFIIILSVLVFVHEFGHFWVARRLGLHPREFGFGFPPRAFGIYKSKSGGWKKVIGRGEPQDAADTVYSINYVPLGGFVNLGEDEEGGDDPDHFSNKKIWQRATILLAGVSMNIILAAVLISIGFMIGLPQVTEGLGAGAQVTNRNIQVVEVMPNTPASQAGLKIGDIIESIDGQTFTTETALQTYVSSHVGDNLNYKIKRGQDEMNVAVTPEVLPGLSEGGVGIGITETGLVRYPFFVAIWQGIKTTVFLTWAIIVAFYQLIIGLIMGHGVSAELAGPVGIAALTGQVARMGFVYILQFTAMLSVNLAIINALPFPALDGGRVLFLIIEKIKGSPVKKEVEATIHNIGFALLMLLVLLVTFKDISRFGDSFKTILQKLSGS